MIDQKEEIINCLKALCKSNRISVGETITLEKAIKELEQTRFDYEQQPCEGMRDATEEERESTKDYIDSISKPTGLQFDDIYEELDFVQPHKKISVNLQFCEDCVSRDEVLKDQLSVYTKEYGEIDVVAVEYIESLPSVTPSYNSIKTELKPCEDCISREEALKVMCDKCPMYNCVTGCSSYRHIEKLPSVQPQPKKGKWEVIRKEYEFMGSVVNEPQGCKCSNCGAIVKFKSDFCPSCGADMREARENDRRRNNDE